MGHGSDNKTRIVRTAYEIHAGAATLCDVPRAIPHMCSSYNQSVVNVHTRKKQKVIRSIDVCKVPSELFQEHVVSGR